LEAVPYTGGPAAALTDVIGGRVPLIIEGYSGLAGAIQAHTVDVLAVGSTHRLPDFPDLPTVAETLPGFAAGGWQGIVAPARNTRGGHSEGKRKPEKGTR
jgi:tripartite-type tricarboxylate transporter receptor subunit TctC